MSRTRRPVRDAVELGFPSAYAIALEQAALGDKRLLFSLYQRRYPLTGDDFDLLLAYEKGQPLGPPKKRGRKVSAAIYAAACVYRLIQRKSGGRVRPGEKRRLIEQLAKRYGVRAGTLEYFIDRARTDDL